MTKAIEVKGLVKQFEALRAVDGLELEIETGECVALLGPNGAGKTTTLEILEGLQSPTSGDVRILGQTWASDRKRLRARLGVQLQQTRFDEHLTVGETLRLFRSFYREGLQVDEALALVRLEEKKDAFVSKLSGGQHQRLALAVTLVGNPELIFLDEPSTGLDPHSRRAIWEVIDDLKARGRTILLTTHYMDEAAYLCGRVIIIDRGRIIAQGRPDELIRTLGGHPLIEVEPSSQLPEAHFESIPGLRHVRVQENRFALEVETLHAAVPAVFARLETAGASALSFSTRERTLDDVFLNLTGRQLREG
jgi:ABC-2 type transport system ATP-binding protein